MMKKGFKAVAVTQRGFESVMTGVISSPLLYVEGEQTVPEEGCGPMCVFTNRNAAENFMTCWKDAKYELHYCEYEPAKGNEIWTHISRKVKIESAGAALADVVILKKKVKNHRV